MGIRRYKHRIGVGAGIVLGLVFITAGVGKLLHQIYPRFLRRGGRGK